MAQLYFKYGAMGSSKTANALMARFNYEERGQRTLLVKPQLDTRDGDHMVYSRIGLKHPCIYFHEMRAMPDEELEQYGLLPRPPRGRLQHPRALLRAARGLQGRAV